MHLDGYDITYSAANRFAQIDLLSQLPRIAATINREHQWLKHAARELQPDGIISDNRYGLHHSSIPSVILTHQLHVMSGMGSLADKAVQRLHYKYLNRFAETWVVDTPTAPGLAGQLSHCARMPHRYKYIGLLSRLTPLPPQEPSASGNHKKILVLISGPEPQRTQLSRMLWQQALGFEGEIVFVEGSDTAVEPPGTPPHIKWHNRVAGMLQEILLTWADVVVCRSGYSTLMDLSHFGKRAVLIPTPGQTEQLYLAATLKKRGAWYSAPQFGFDLKTAVESAMSPAFTPPAFAGAFQLHQPVLNAWLDSL